MPNSAIGTWVFLFVALIFAALIPDASAFGRKRAETSARQESAVRDCSSTREYVTTLEFLRSEKSVALTEEAARRTSSDVAKGCSGAAKRFIGVVRLLIRANVAPADAVKTGLEFALDSQEKMETFSEIFASAYAEDGLDLDAGSALRMARSLSTGFNGDQVRVRRDFARLVRFCASTRLLDLPLPLCGAMAVRIAARGEGFGGGVAGPFIEVFGFLTSDRGPHLITGDALKTAETLIGHGSRAVENFVQAYRYGRSDSGLKLDNGQAIDFGMKMAALSTQVSAESKGQ